MAKAKKIKKAQLEKVTEQQNKLNELLRGLGVLDVQKQNIHIQVNEISVEIEATKKELEDEYGKVTITLSDGTYTTKVKETSNQ